MVGRKIFASHEKIEIPPFPQLNTHLYAIARCFARGVRREAESSPNDLKKREGKERRLFGETLRSSLNGYLPVLKINHKCIRRGGRVDELQKFIFEFLKPREKSKLHRKNEWSTILEKEEEEKALSRKNSANT